MCTENRTNSKGEARKCKDDPQFFGLYLNLALANIMEVENHIRKTGNNEPQRALNDDQMIASSLLASKQGFKKITDINSWMPRFARAQRYLPMLRCFDSDKDSRASKKDRRENYGLDPTKTSRTLHLLFTWLNELRNQLSHSTPPSTDEQEQAQNHTLRVNKEMRKTLLLCYEKAVEKAAERLAAASYTKEDFSIALKFPSNGESDQFTLFKKDESNETAHQLTDYGLTYLICLFLDREQAFSMISRVTGFKNTSKKTFNAVRETFCQFCIKHPHERILSDNPKQALMLDMTNELTRCPKMLFDRLSEAHQKPFLPILDEDAIANAHSNSLNDDNREESASDEEWLRNFSKRIRHEDRMPYFILRYLEELNEDNTTLLPIRFCIDLGKIQIAEYDKKIGKEEVDRTVCKQVFAFGRLKDFMNEEEVINQIRGELKDVEHIRFSHFAPRYAIKDNKIGYIAGVDNVLPRLVEKTPCKNENIPYKIATCNADAFISTNDLRKLLILHFIDEKTAKNALRLFTTNWKKFYKELESNSTLIQAQIDTALPRYSQSQGKKAKKSHEGHEEKQNSYLTKIERRKGCLKDFLAEHTTLKLDQIPSRLVDQWLNIKASSPQNRLEKYIEREKAQNKKRLRPFLQLDKPKSSTDAELEDDRGVSLPKVGDMAKELSQDLIGMLTDESIKAKISSAVYNEIQRCLAQYAGEENRRQFATICQDYKFAEKHPFLSNVLSTTQRYTEDFYRAYFEAKKTWLEKTFYTTKDRKTVFSTPDEKKLPLSFRKLLKPLDSIESWLQTKKNHPIEIASSYLDELLSEQLKKEGFDKGKWNQAFKAWWDIKFTGGVQNFYRAPRQLEIGGLEVKYQHQEGKSYKDQYDEQLQELIKTRKANPNSKGKKNDNEFTENALKQQFRRRINEVEYQLRLSEEDDRLLFCCIESLYDGPKDKLSLNQINDFFVQEIAVEQEIGTAIDRDGKEVSVKLVAQRKRKDVALLMRYRYDRRILGLLSHYHDSGGRLELDDLRKQLRDYDRFRIEVFDLAFALENLIKARFRTELLEKIRSSQKSGNRFLHHSDYIDILVQKEIIDETKAKFIKHIRNSAAHNKFPIEKGDDDKDCIGICGQLAWDTLTDQLRTNYKAVLSDLAQKMNDNDHFFVGLLD